MGWFEFIVCGERWFLMLMAIARLLPLFLSRIENDEINMKKVELAIRNILENKPVLNKDALMNPEALDYYAGIKDLEED